MSIAIGRMRFAVVAAVLAAVLSLALVSSSFAGGEPTANNATVSITGGNAKALSACVNVASKAAKHNKKLQLNACKNFARADGGDVNLKNVTVTIAQTGTTANNAAVNIEGGDATAVAACVNYLEGDATSAQVNICKNTAVAKGGDVNLKNVDITILQG